MPQLLVVIGFYCRICPGIAVVFSSIRFDTCLVSQLRWGMVRSVLTCPVPACWNLKETVALTTKRDIKSQWLFNWRGPCIFPLFVLLFWAMNDWKQKLWVINDQQLKTAVESIFVLKWGTSLHRPAVWSCVSLLFSALSLIYRYTNRNDSVKS